LPASKFLEEKTIELMQGWIQECIDSHKECRRSAGSYVPTRLLDIGDIDGKLQPRLIIPKGNLEEHYATLSYCWGDGNFLKTTTSNIQGMVEGISLERYYNFHFNASHNGSRGTSN
jgi:hypothetical protein